MTDQQLPSTHSVRHGFETRGKRLWKLRWPATGMEYFLPSTSLRFELGGRPAIPGRSLLKLSPFLAIIHSKQPFHGRPRERRLVLAQSLKIVVREKKRKPATLM
ncbi:MAG: hypothetical protein M3552_19455 [Planctomycetota bacterium]|nr:hypothetical protein [Planctomycetota bacterium]